MSSDDDVQQQAIGQIARVLAKCDGFEDPLPPHTEQASRVYAHVVARLLVEARHQGPETDCGQVEAHPGHAFPEAGSPVANLWCSGVLHPPVPLGRHGRHCDRCGARVGYVLCDPCTDTLNAEAVALGDLP